MKTIGLLGGMSWESTVGYYQVINRTVARCLGGLHSARLVMYSVDFAPIERLQQEGSWDEAAKHLSAAAQSLEAAGAELLVLCTNTMHIIAPQLEAAVSMPLLHIADATADHIASTGMRKVGLLGTHFTMEQAFYRGRLEEKHGLDVLTPPATERKEVHRIIYEELCRGRIGDASRAIYLDIVASLVARGCEGIILGCTEIGLLLRQEDTPTPLFDTTSIHAERAALLALGMTSASSGRQAGHPSGSS